MNVQLRSELLGYYLSISQESMQEQTKKEICTKELLCLWQFDENSPHLSLFKPFHNQGKLEVTFNGQCLAVKISNNINNLIEIGLCVRDKVTDKHSANVIAFSSLKIIPFKIKLLYIAPTKEQRNILWDSVHLMKTSEIRNLLNKTSLCFQSLLMI